MDIVNMPKFAAGIALLLIGIFILVYTRATRGFNRTRQTAAILLAGGALFVANGLGFDVKSLF
jgi:hypothetical protein